MNNYLTYSDRAVICERESANALAEYKVWCDVQSNLSLHCRWSDPDRPQSWCINCRNISIQYEWDGEFYHMSMRVDMGDHGETIRLDSEYEPILPHHLYAEVVKRRTKAFETYHHLKVEAEKFRLLSMIVK